MRNSHFFRCLVIIWWREFDDEPTRGNLYRIESYTRLIKKENETGTHTHNRVIVIARGGTGEIHPFFITRLRNRRSRIVSTNLYCGDIFVETRKRNRQPEIIFVQPQKRWTEDRKKRDTKMKLLFLWIYLAQSAKILVWPAEWSHWINMKVNIHTDCMIQSWIISHLLRNGIRQIVANHYDSTYHH